MTFLFNFFKIYYINIILKYTFMKKILFLALFVIITNALSAQIINNFEAGTSSITSNSAVYRNQNSTQFSIMQCNVSPTIGNVFSPAITINNFSSKNSIMTGVNEPILASYGINIPVVGQNGGNYSLRLNNNQPGYDITSYTQTFMPTSKYLSFDYLAVLDSPHTSPDEVDVQPFFTARLLDLNNNIIQSLPLCVKAVSNDPILSTQGSSLFYTKNFYCQTLIIPEKYINKENIKVQFVVSDCGLGGDRGMVYLDNIRMGEICDDQPYGILKLNPVKPECNPKKIKVTGTYTPPAGTTYLYSKLTILNSNGAVVNVPNNNIVLDSFGNGSFIYTINLNPPLPIGSYEIRVTATFTTPSGVLYHVEDISTNEGADITFSDGVPLVVITINNNPAQIPLPGMAKWNDVGGPYVIEYVSDGYCCPEANSLNQNIDQIIYSIEIFDNYINGDTWEYMVNTMMSKCLRFRVKSACTKWSEWCCITTYPWGNSYFSECLEEIDLNHLDPNQSLTAYPNPTTGLITVTNSGALTFDIYDLNQQKVKSKRINQTQEKVNIDLSDLKPGIYILKTDRGQEIKIIKQ